MNIHKAGAEPIILQGLPQSKSYDAVLVSFLSYRGKNKMDIEAVFFSYYDKKLNESTAA